MVKNRADLVEQLTRIDYAQPFHLISVFSRIITSVSIYRRCRWLANEFHSCLSSERERGRGKKKARLHDPAGYDTAKVRVVCSFSCLLFVCLESNGSISRYAKVDRTAHERK